MRRSLVAFAVLVIIAVIGLVGASRGWFWFVEPSLKEFPVRGVDVSHHQGEIDWARIRQQGIHFAYIKATEGGDFKDRQFQRNWQAAKSAGLRVGAYHFFTSKTDGALQADNFIQSVPCEVGMLPPVIDVENEIVADPTQQQIIRDRLGILLRRVEAYYGMRPLIYTDAEAYPVYVAPQFDDYPLWYRSIFGKPDLPQGKSWAIWQYNPRGVLEGYEGREKYIDLNVFNGSHAVFAEFGH
ncbi:GH25 family lysozyme [Bartonella sp. LJL80]